MKQLQWNRPEIVKPPVTSVGVIGWVRANLFNNIFNSILTLVVYLLLGASAPALYSMGVHRQSLVLHRRSVPKRRKVPAGR